jgi:hypothetical protein
MHDSFHPTPFQAALYRQLELKYGHTEMWAVLTKARSFDRMTAHRAAHFLSRLVEGLTGRRATVPCGCTGSTYAATRKHPDVRPGAPVRRLV